MLIVIDTDILVSTAGHPDKRFAIWEALRGGRMIAATSEAAIAELELVVARPIVRSALPLLEKNFASFLTEYRSLAQIIPPPPERFILKIDPKDSLFFNIAIEAQAQILTTFNVRHILPVRERATLNMKSFANSHQPCDCFTQRNSLRKSLVGCEAHPGTNVSGGQNRSREGLVL